MSECVLVLRQLEGVERATDVPTGRLGNPTLDLASFQRASVLFQTVVNVIDAIV